MKNLLEKMLKDGGVIVNSAKLTRLEIAQAQSCNRFYVDENSLGFALMPTDYSLIRRLEDFIQDVDITLDFAISDKEKLNMIEKHLNEFVTANP